MFLFSPRFLGSRMGLMPIELIRALEALDSFDSDSSPATPKQFPMDIVEHDDHYVAEIEMPGVASEDLKIEVRGSCVTIEVRRKAAERTGRTLYSDRRVSRSERFMLDLRGLAADGHEARLVDGVLTLTLRKQVREQPKVQTIPVK